MSKIVIENNKSTNLKPDSWYEEYAKLYGGPIELLKEKDISINIGLDYIIMGQSEFEFYLDEFDIHSINTLEGNQLFLKECIMEVKSLGVKISKSKIFDLCSKALQNGYLVSQDLRDIACEIYYFKKNKDNAKPIIEIIKQFKFDDYQEELSNFIKSNVNWLHKDRDFKIHKEIKDGTLYSEIAERLNCSISAISKINKKVQSSINNLKGRFFEIKYQNYLKSLNKFRNGDIIRDGTPGKPDIYIINKTNKELYVFSLKNLELNNKSFAITKEQLKPELEFAYLKNSFESFNMVYLYLIVFDSLTENLYVRELDYKNPSNINIHS